LPDVTEEAVCAAWLHDVLEDCPQVQKCHWDTFPPDVYDLVVELTNPSKQHPKLPRAERKKMDREHIAKASYWARAIKLLDRIDNLQEMSEADDTFVAIYCQESLLLSSAIRGGSESVVIEDLCDALDSIVAYANDSR
jgi:(p)ppGpp synthase/HD superfamily hydrolase